MTSSVRALVVALGSVTASCILFVSPEPGGAHCRFAGEDTACGKCIAFTCQEAVDRTCVARPDTLARLDACASRRDSSCDALRADRSSAETAELASCVTTRCAGSCAEAVGTSLTRCAPEPYGDGRQCACSVSSDKANDFACAEAVQPGTICCAAAGWPAEGLSCRCHVFDCNPNSTGTGCFCSLSAYTSGSPLCEGVGCCANGNQCRCGGRACSGDDRPVTSCTRDVVACGEGQVRVESCSIRSP
jgi:hypothetical protein